MAITQLMFIGIDHQKSIYAWFTLKAGAEKAS